MYILLKKELSLIYFILNYIRAEDFTFIKVLYFLLLLMDRSFLKTIQQVCLVLLIYSLFNSSYLCIICVFYKVVGLYASKSGVIGMWSGLARKEYQPVTRLIDNYKPILIFFNILRFLGEPSLFYNWFYNIRVNKVPYI